MAKYLREEVFKQGDDGEFHCTWRSGLDVVQPGYRTYVSNTEERYWRTLKGILPRGYRTQDCSELILKIGEILETWSTQDKFSDAELVVSTALEVPWEHTLGQTGKDTAQTTTLPGPYMFSS